ncbi:hypothetical protein F511_07891 [Dorcoceras hygrometricum]|uniref:Protein TIC 21, chloroplastic n=1 Tax=Dorcoceras hygrometricum TaxID=472368 RepID=A0A2Z7ASL5_9LAMI|nr:hypothetical protein F511_07891 [Dorcoceras hygrometricum]
MPTLLLPAARSAVSPPPPPFTAALRKPLWCNQSLRFSSTINPHPYLSSLKWLRGLSSPYLFLNSHSRKPLSPAPFSAAYNSTNGDSENGKLAQVSKRLESTSRNFKRWGNFGFWGQLVSTVVAATILSFSVVISGKVTSPATFYSTAAGIAAGFIAVFWSFGYIRLSEKLRKTASDPSKAPPRADVVKSLKNGIAINLLGMGAAILGMQATVGLLVAKALTTSSNPYYQGSPGGSPVLALDVFLVQASANTILSHFLGLISSLELLRSVTLPPSENAPSPKLA